jgi:hypothetical protein
MTSPIWKKPDLTKWLRNCSRNIPNAKMRTLTASLLLICTAVALSACSTLSFWKAAGWRMRLRSWMKNKLVNVNIAKAVILYMTPHSTPQDQHRRFLALVAGVVLITCTGCQTYTHPKFRECSAHLTTVAFLPPQIRTGLADTWASAMAIQPGSPLPEEAKMQSELPGLIAAEFRQRGYAAKDFSSESLLPNSTNLVWDARMVGMLNAARETVHLKAVRPEAKVLADHVQADGLVFLSVFAYKSTAGRKVGVVLNNLAMFGGGGGTWAHFSQAMVQIVLVDGETGDVLWRTMHDFTDLEKTRLDQVVAELFKKYPQQ